MVFSSPFFLFVFLPIVLLLICISFKQLHNYILLGASLIFYSWGNISQTPIFLFSIVFNYLAGILLNKANKKNEKFILFLAVSINLLLLFYFKYFNFLIDNINTTILKDAPISNNPISLPIGISFFTFHSLSYIIDVYRKKVEAQKNIFNLALYISFFPQLIAGPIVRYIDVSEQIKKRTLSLEKTSAGIQRFIFGLAKKVIIANSMAYLADQIFNLPINELSGGLAWLGIIAYTIQIYFDFSGYSDMAIGLAKIFGFNFLENFNYPYSATSIKDFWRKWHISLSTWFRDFLYIPLGGNRGSQLRTTINLLIVFLCTGFWHGASWNFVFWGLFHGAFLLIEKWGWGKIIERVWKPIQIAYTLLIVMIGWVFFRIENLGGGILFLKKMTFLTNAEYNKHFFIEFFDFKVFAFILFASLYSFRIFRGFLEKTNSISITSNRETSYLWLFQSGKFIISMLLLVISISYLASSSYNPFIYFRF